MWYLPTKPHLCSFPALFHSSRSTMAVFLSIKHTKLVSLLEPLHLRLESFSSIFAYMCPHHSWLGSNENFRDSVLSNLLNQLCLFPMFCYSPPQYSILSFIASLISERKSYLLTDHSVITLNANSWMSEPQAVLCSAVFPLSEIVPNIHQ